MAVAQFDAVDTIRELKSVGVPDDQAETWVKALLNAIDFKMAHSDEVATKRDLKELELRITDIIAGVQREVANVRREIADTKTEIIKWVAGMLVVQFGILLGSIIAVVKLLIP